MVENLVDHLQKYVYLSYHRDEKKTAIASNSNRERKRQREKKKVAKALKYI